jgi:hypothetical protein
MRLSKIILGTLFVLFVLVIISLLFSNGRFFWNQVLVTPALKPFSDICGYGGTSEYRVDCECKGFLFSDVKIGSTSHFCFGECGPCSCYEQSWMYTQNGPEANLTEMDCSELSHLSWAFSHS